MNLAHVTRVHQTSRPGLANRVCHVVQTVKDDNYDEARRELELGVP